MPDAGWSSDWRKADSIMNDLLTILRRIRDGKAAPAEVARARALLRDDARLDDELRSVALSDPEDLAGDAAGLLAVLGGDDLGAILAGAVLAEAGPAPPTITEIDLDEQGFSLGPAIARAVRDDAGHVEVANEVLRACGLEDPLPVAEAVRGEAGGVDIAEAVIPWAAVDVGETVRAESGPVDIVNAVMAEIAEGPVQAAPRSLPRPANDTRGFVVVGLVLAAAVALLVSIAGIDTRGDPLPALAFAHADEVVVEDLTSDTDVLMLQGGGQDGALILWVDEET